MFSLICVWINDWVNNREAGYLRRHHTHYDVIVMVRNCLFRGISRLAVLSMLDVVTFLIFDEELLLNIAWDWSAESYVMMTSPKWKHFPRYWSFVWGIHWSPVNSPHKGQWRGTLMFSLICVWSNDWVNNREAADLRRYHAHYDVIVMVRSCLFRGISRLGTLSMPNVVTFLIFDVDLLLNIARDWSALYVMMTSSNGNIFRVTGPLCR